jgi:hypothetical protein
MEPSTMLTPDEMVAQLHERATDNGDRIIDGPLLVNVHDPERAMGFAVGMRVRSGLVMLTDYTWDAPRQDWKATSTTRLPEHVVRGMVAFYDPEHSGSECGQEP